MRFYTLKMAPPNSKVLYYVFWKYFQKHDNKIRVLQAKEEIAEIFEQEKLVVQEMGTFRFTTKNLAYYLCICLSTYYNSFENDFYLSNPTSPSPTLGQFCEWCYYYLNEENGLIPDLVAPLMEINGKFRFAFRLKDNEEEEIIENP